MTSGHAAHYNFFRTYDPVTGRYLEADPIGQAGGLNPYVYAFSDPVGFTDSSGLCLEDACLVEGAIAVATFWKASAFLGSATLAAWGIDTFLHELSADDGEPPEASIESCPAPDGSHDKERQALDDLLDDLTNGNHKPLTAGDADAALELAKELGIKASDHRDEDHWLDGTPHVHIPGSGIPHIRAATR